MQYRIEMLTEKELVGKKIKMSFSVNKTIELWQSFMPRRKEIKNIIDTILYSVEIYNDSSFFKNFDMNKEFEKWAAIEVTDFKLIPNGMEKLIIPNGLYAVFQYKGKASEATKTYQYIFETWIPSSEYLLDDRPHFALMGEKYKNEDSSSEEELWIPIKEKK